MCVHITIHQPELRALQSKIPSAEIFREWGWRPERKFGFSKGKLQKAVDKVDTLKYVYIYIYIFRI